MSSYAKTMTTLAGLILASASLVFAQNLDVKPRSAMSSRNREAIEVSRDQVRSDRKNLVAKAMKLTDDEAQGFWRIYDEYSSELSKISDRTVALITKFADNYKRSS